MAERRIDGFIVGAAKSGTSAATLGMLQHPEISVHRTPGEMVYFLSDEVYADGWERAESRYFDNDGKPYLLAKNVGVMLYDEALSRLQEHNPGVKIFLFLREPASRAYSDYWFSKRQGWEPCETFEEAIHASQDRFKNSMAAEYGLDYIDRGLYAKHLARVQKYFPMENITTFLSEDMERDMSGVLRRIAEITCGHDATDWNPYPNRQNSSRVARSSMIAHAVIKRFTGRRIITHSMPGRIRDRLRTSIQKWNSKPFTPPPMNHETRAELLKFYAEPNAELAKMIGRDLSAWND